MDKNLFKNIKFIETDDKSIGLYSDVYKDIFHSKTGALKEANEKFIHPIKNLNFNFEIKILDICYGIGYNTKSALVNLGANHSIEIDALELNPEYILISPLISDLINDNELKIFMLEQIFKNFKDLEVYKEVLKYICFEKLNTFFDKFIIDFMTYLFSSGYILLPDINQQGFLHNIYYKYISNNNLYYDNTNKYAKHKINYFNGDSRKSIQLLNNVYDVVFLDAFSPQKSPALWTIDFLAQIKKLIHDNSVIVSYSKSTPFRSALLELGFHVGKTFIDYNECGTIASLNINNISNPLSDFDYQIIKTTSGVVYRDKFLNASDTDIINNRNIDMKLSGRQSRTSFMKFSS